MSSSLVFFYSLSYICFVFSNRATNWKTGCFLLISSLSFQFALMRQIFLKGIFRGLCFQESLVISAGRWSSSERKWAGRMSKQVLQALCDNYPDASTWVSDSCPHVEVKSLLRFPLPCFVYCLLRSNTIGSKDKSLMEWKVDLRLDSTAVINRDRAYQTLHCSRCSSKL